MTETATATATATATLFRLPEAKEDSPKPRTAEQRQQSEQTNAGNRDDTYAEGNVIALGQDAQGSFAVIGNRDGTMVIRLQCGDQCPMLRPGDYIQVDGVKENEQLFYAHEVSVSR